MIGNLILKERLSDMQRVFFLLLISVVWALPLWAKNDSVKVYQGFSGGMMLHAGALFGTNKYAPTDATGALCSPQGATFGIGGALRVHLWKYLRVGSEGFVSTMNAATTDCRNLQSGSYIRTGWGGVLADVCWRGDKVWPYVGGTIGGGAMRSFFLIEGNEDDWKEEERALFHKQTFFMIDPYVGLDWCMTEKVHVTFRLDWMLAIHHRDLLMPSGPRLYVGFMFCH